MKSSLMLTKQALVLMAASLLLLTGCGGSNNNGGGGGGGGGATAIFPAINPAFDEITEVAVSPDPGEPYEDILDPEAGDYKYDPETESITSKASVDAGGAYVRITGLATVTGTQSTYTVYTFVTKRGDRVAANELTSAAVGLVASGDAADFEEALGLVEEAFGLPAGSAAEPLPAAERSAELTSVLAAAAPAFAEGADPAFDVDNTTAEELAAGQAAYMDCVVQGGLAYDSWHKTDAGGSGLPTDEPDNDYTRCKACHGWDQQGTEGGYDQRSRNSGRANAGYQDPNNCDLGGADTATCTPSRNISTDATFGRGAAIEIPAGGRTWAQGSAVFDMVDPEWGPGAILGNRHPDLGPDNPEGPTAQQLSCLTAFLNAPMARTDQVYAAIDTMPADGESLNIYTPVDAADATAGEAYYGANCQGCHGDPSDDSTGVSDGLPGTGGMIGYLNQDGKFSEFMHKMHWGIPDTIMGRAAMGDPTAADVANVVAWMQAIPFRELSAAQEVPPVEGITARGSGTYTLTGAGLEYVINVDRSNLSGPIRSAHFHQGRVGTNGDVVRTLEFTGGGQAIGIWTSTDDEPLTPELRQALLDGNIYVNVHTDANPSGEIRGQVRATQEGGNQPPVADIAVDPAINVAPDTEVTLDGSGSSDPDDGPAALTYAWTLDAPAGSTAELSDPAAASPTFTADIEGAYLVTLTVSDGLADDTADVTVTASAGNLPPVADAGPDQAVDTGSEVTLDGSGSSDPDDGPQPLTYAWTLEVPAGSTATLSDPTSATPTFTADLDGDYTATLMVNDGEDDSPADMVTVTATTANQAPVADAGEDQAVDTGSEVTLDGSGSSDPDDGPQPLTYAWTLDSVPAGSGATLANADTASPTFTADLDGDYVASLVVNDGLDDSAADSVTVTATPGLPEPTPSELAGRDQYDAECAGCHSAPDWDNSAGGGGNLTQAGAQPVIADLTAYSGAMSGVSPLTDQEVIDLNAFLNGICVQVPAQCQ
jgi:cytochrome c2/cytochrome c553